MDQSSSDPDRLSKLLAATSAGDRVAFKRLYELTSGKLFGVIVRILRDRDDAAEVLQEVYLKIWRRAGDYRAAKGTPMSWLIAIARNRALDWQRSRRIELPLDEEDGMDQWPDPAPNPLQQTIAQAASRLLGHCLKELEARQRQCVLLAYRDGYTHVELAARQGHPLGTIKSWIRRGLAQLKDCLER